jgi:hypothetical protein
MSDMAEDLEGHYHVQESRVINHPEYYKPVLLTRFGWAKRQGLFGAMVSWYKQEISEIKEDE